MVSLCHVSVHWSFLSLAGHMSQWVRAPQNRPPAGREGRLRDPGALGRGWLGENDIIERRCQRDWDCRHENTTWLGQYSVVPMANDTAIEDSIKSEINKFEGLKKGASHNTDWRSGDTRR